MFVIELDDGKILTGKPYINLMVSKNHGFRLRFSQQHQSIEFVYQAGYLNISLHGKIPPFSHGINVRDQHDSQVRELRPNTDSFAGTMDSGSASVT